MGIFKKIFTWWDGATFGTLFSWRHGAGRQRRFSATSITDARRAAAAG